MLTFQKVLPEETGVPSECILHMISRLQSKQVPMHSLLLMRHDKLITEGYYAPCRADSLHRMFSISKSFTSVAIGLLAEEGKLSLKDPIVSYFPDKVPAHVHPYIAAMTIEDMLMMRTCHASTTYKLNSEKDWVESFFTVEPTHPAGKIFHYDTSSAHTLCALAERLSGRSLLDYLKEKLAPLGLSGESYMLTDPFGVSMGGTGLVALSQDLLRFAFLISHKGLVEGRQLLSADYIEMATSRLSDTRMTAPLPSEAQGYGYQFWRGQHDGFTCYGMGGQLILFLPKYDLICITTADTQGMAGGNQLIYDALYEEILPYLSDTPLPVSDAQTAAYEDTLHHLSLAPLMGATDTALEKQISGMVFQAAPNAAGFETLSLEWTDTTGTLIFTRKEQEYRFSFGMGHMVTGKFPVYDLNYAASGIWVSRDTLYLRVHIIDAYVGSLHFELAFGHSPAGPDLTVFMKKQEESLFQEFNGHLYCTPATR